MPTAATRTAEKLPDGNSATLDEMVSAQKAIKEYNKAIESYVSCIKLEHDSAASKVGEKPSPEQKKALDDMERVEVQKHNAAIDQLQSVAARFNEQVRLFKAKHKTSRRLRDRCSSPSRLTS